MSRKNPLSDVDLAIARRLKQIRLDRQFSREDLAERAQVSFGVVTRVELGLMPLRYFDARRILRGLSIGGAAWPDLRPINPLWLAEGSDPVEVAWPLVLPAIHHLQIEPATSFSSFIRANRDLLSALLKGPEGAQLPELWLPTYLNHWDILRRKALALSTDAATVEQLFVSSAGKLAPQSPRAAALLLDYRAELSETSRLQPLGAEKQSLTDVTVTRNNVGVTSLLANLRARLHRATSSRGQKAALAAHLHVPAPRVSEWLRKGGVEPSGEICLRLLNWVEQQEAQQQRPPGRAPTRPGAKTRHPQSKHENERSNPPQ